MRNLSTLMLFGFLLPVLAVAQDYTKIEQAMSPQEVATMELNDPEALVYLEFKANHCYSVQDLSGKKDISEFPDISILNEHSKNQSIPALNADDFDPAAFNPLLYTFDQGQNMAYFRVGNSGQLLKVIPEERCRSMFKN